MQIDINAQNESLDCCNSVVAQIELLADLDPHEALDTLKELFLSVKGSCLAVQGGDEAANLAYMTGYLHAKTLPTEMLPDTDVSAIGEIKLVSLGQKSIDSPELVSMMNGFLMGITSSIENKPGHHIDISDKKTIMEMG